MVYTSFQEALAAVKAGKHVFAHAPNSEYPVLTIVNDEVLLDGTPIKAQHVFFVYESTEDPSWMLTQVLHSLFSGSSEVYETVGNGEKASAYISNEDEHSRTVQIVFPRHSVHPLTATWRRL